MSNGLRSARSMARNARCRACSLREGCQTVCLYGEGSQPCDVMVIGEAPGFFEDQQGRPFVGASGQKLRQDLASAGIKSYYITNAVKCRPPENKLPIGRELSQVLESCLQHLYREIAAVKPKYILTLGNTPLRALTGRPTKITQARGTKIKQTFKVGSYEWEATIFPAYHPAFILRQQGLDKIFRLDLATFAQLVNGIDDSNYWEGMDLTHITYTEEVATLLDIHRRVKEEGWVQVYDIETASNDPRIPSVECPPEEGTIPYIGVGYFKPEPFKFRGFIIPWEHPRRKTNKKALYSALKAVLEDDNFRRTAHHGRFDDRWLRSRGIRPVRTFDTFNAAYLLDENIPHNLEDVSKMYTGAPDWKDQFDYSKLVEYPITKVAEYLGRDLFTSAKSYAALRRELAKDQGLARVFKHIIMPADLMLLDAAEHGLWVDEEKLESVTESLNKKREECLVKLEELSPIKGVNWNSTQQKVKVLFAEDGLGLTPIKATKGGGWSTDKDVLAQLEEQTQSPVIIELRHYMKVEMLCRFLSRWKLKLDRAKEVRGESRIYTQFNVARTVTGRLSSEDPDGTGDNLQQVPARGEGSELKQVFGAPPGRVLVSADYSQIELRVAAQVVPERAMQKLFREGRDLHTYMAAIVTHKPEEEITKEERTRAKPVNFGYLFTMQPPRFVRYALTDYGQRYTLEEATAVQQAYYRAYPDLPGYYRRVQNTLRSLGHVRSPLGRIRRLPEVFSPDKFAKSEAERQAINFPIQSTASDMTLLAAVRLNQVLPPEVAKVILLVHDSIVLEATKGYEDAVARTVKETMEQWVVQFLAETFGVKFSVPILSEVEIGIHWGKGEVWKG